MTSYQHTKSHCGDKTVVSSSYLHNVISYTGKMASLYWTNPQVLNYGEGWTINKALCNPSFAQYLSTLFKRERYLVYSLKTWKKSYYQNKFVCKSLWYFRTQFNTSLAHKDEGWVVFFSLWPISQTFFPSQLKFDGNFVCCRLNQVLK